ncbi:hypothetical protein M2164_004210 [Streptomyces sp. SAI-208]|nr:hypothetical protein [Streptomyces sp. SAI-208]
MRESEVAEPERARIRAGDRAAFGELYDRYARAVYNHALRLTGNWAEAEEAMSETFLAALTDPERGITTETLAGTSAVMRTAVVDGKGEVPARNAAR